MFQEFSKWLVRGYNLLINGVYWGYNPLTNLLLASWDILACVELDDLHLVLEGDFFTLSPDAPNGTGLYLPKVKNGAHEEGEMAVR